MADLTVSSFPDDLHTILNRCHPRILAPKGSQIIGYVAFQPARLGAYYITSRPQQRFPSGQSLAQSHEINCALRPNEIEAFRRKRHCKHRPSNAVVILSLTPAVIRGGG